MRSRGSLWLLLFLLVQAWSTPVLGVRQPRATGRGTAEPPTPAHAHVVIPDAPAVNASNVSMAEPLPWPPPPVGAAHGVGEGAPGAGFSPPDAAAGGAHGEAGELGGGPVAHVNQVFSPGPPLTPAERPAERTSAERMRALRARRSEAAAADERAANAVQHAVCARVRTCARDYAWACVTTRGRARAYACVSVCVCAHARMHV